MSPMLNMMRRLKLTQEMKKEVDVIPLSFKVFYINNLFLIFILCVLYWVSGIYNIEFVINSVDKDSSLWLIS